MPLRKPRVIVAHPSKAESLAQTIREYKGRRGNGEKSLELIPVCDEGNGLDLLRKGNADVFGFYFDYRREGGAGISPSLGERIDVGFDPNILEKVREIAPEAPLICFHPQREEITGSYFDRNNHPVGIETGSLESMAEFLLNLPVVLAGRVGEIAQEGRRANIAGQLCGSPNGLFTKLEYGLYRLLEPARNISPPSSAFILPYDETTHFQGITMDALGWQDYSERIGLILSRVMRFNEKMGYKDRLSRILPSDNPLLKSLSVGERGESVFRLCHHDLLRSQDDFISALSGTDQKEKLRAFFPEIILNNLYISAMDFILSHEYSALKHISLNQIQAILASRESSLKTTQQPLMTYVSSLMAPVLVNLVRNATQGSATSVYIGEERGEEHVSVLVTDNGNGISPENLARMFFGFSMSGESGRGQGMQITKELVDMMGGSIEVSSRKCGKPQHHYSLKTRMATKRGGVRMIYSESGTIVEIKLPYTFQQEPFHKPLTFFGQRTPFDNPSLCPSPAPRYKF